MVCVPYLVGVCGALAVVVPTERVVLYGVVGLWGRAVGGGDGGRPVGLG